MPELCNLQNVIYCVILCFGAVIIMLKKFKNISIILVSVLAVLVCYAFLSQILIPHQSFSFDPDYDKINLDENSSFKEIFLQTGLGKTAAEKVLETEGLAGIKNYQETFFKEREIYCKSLLGFVTKSDCLKDTVEKPTIAEIKEGDILLTLSNHTLGWRHGHAGIAVDSRNVAESAILGSDSEVYDINTWCDYGRFAVLRLKNITPEMQKEISNYVSDNLVGVPYKLTSGYFGDKAPEIDSKNFGVHCSYLVWYAYNHFGFDIDSDGGRLASTYDILHSPLLEVVQIYGLDPREFT